MPRKNQGRKRVQRVSLKAERRDQPDWDRFAFALLQHTKTVSKPPLPPKVKKDKSAP